MDSKNIFCFVCTKLQKRPEIPASRLEYPLKNSNAMNIFVNQHQQGKEKEYESENRSDINYFSDQTGRTNWVRWSTYHKKHWNICQPIFSSPSL